MAKNTTPRTIPCPMIKRIEMVNDKNFSIMSINITPNPRTKSSGK